jgi:hypothetical protein
LIIAVAVLGLAIFAYPSMPILIAETPTLTTTNQSTYTDQSPYTTFSTISSTTTALATTTQSTYHGCESVEPWDWDGGGWVVLGCYSPVTFTNALYVSTTLWQVASTTTYELTSTTTFPSYYESTMYHTNTVPPYAYYGFSGASFAGVALVVLVLYGAIGFYSLRTGKRQAQVKLIHSVSKQPNCVKCGATLPPDSKFCEKCGSAQD